MADIAAFDTQFDIQEVHRMSSAGLVEEDQAAENRRVAAAADTGHVVAVEVDNTMSLARRSAEKNSSADQRGQGHAWIGAVVQMYFA